VGLPRRRRPPAPPPPHRCAPAPSSSCRAPARPASPPPRVSPASSTARRLDGAQIVIVDALKGEPGDSTYHGSTSCRLITKVGRATRIGFDYDNNVTPSLPAVIALLEELWISWVIEEMALEPTHLAVSRGPRPEETTKQDVEPGMFLAVLYEMLGPMPWAIVVGGIVATLAFLGLLIRDRGLVSRRFVVSELVGVVGGFGAVLFMQLITHSGLADVAGPLDRLLMVSIWLIGAIGTTVIVYDLRGLRAGRRAPLCDHT
jgi:hypothetical protein